MYPDPHGGDCGPCVVVDVSCDYRFAVGANRLGVVDLRDETSPRGGRPRLKMRKVVEVFSTGVIQQVKTRH